jgi:hypothetical protein
MEKLLLDSLEIQHFRGFRHLHIEKLGRVNLIVGKNNIGKTALLEALQLYASHGSPRMIWQSLRERNELRYPGYNRPVPTGARIGNVEDWLNALKYVFYGRKEINGNSLAISVGPINTLEERLQIFLGWFARELDQSGVPLRWCISVKQNCTPGWPGKRSRENRWGRR